MKKEIRLTPEKRLKKAWNNEARLETFKRGLEWLNASFLVGYLFYLFKGVFNTQDFVFQMLVFTILLRTHLGKLK